MRYISQPRQSRAAGQERVGARLDTFGEVDVITLHDRRIPGSRANIDHLVAAPWGIWIVDAKQDRGNKVGFDIVDSERQVSKVTEFLGADVEVRGCLCIVDVEWPLLLADFSIRDTCVCWPKKLAKALLRSEPPRLDPEAIARQLAAKFPAA